MGETKFQAEIERFDTLYVASLYVSHAAVRSHSWDELLKDVVRVLVDVGKFAMAFVSWLDPAIDELVPVVRFGDTEGYVDRVRFFTGPGPEGQSSALTAFRAGVPYLCNDLMNDPGTLPWREAAKAAGWRASASFPVSIGGSPRGLLSVYALEPGGFGPYEVTLLQEVTLDLAFARERFEDEERRCQTEAALSASEHRLKLTIDAVGLGTFDGNLLTGKFVWDGHHERIFGFKPGSFDGTYAAFESRIHPDDLHGLNRAVYAARDTRGIYSHEFRILWPDGSEHWVMGRGVFSYSESGQPIRMYGAVLDISEQKRIEAALRQSEEMLRQAVRVSDLGIFDHDHITGAIYWSPEQRAIHGLDPDEPITMLTYKGLTHPGDLARIDAAVKRAHDPAGDGLFDVEQRLLLPDGSIRWTRTRSQTFFAGRVGKWHPVRTVGAVQDITEQKQAAEEQKKLAAMVAMSRDFIGIATLEGQGLYLNRAGMSLVGIESVEEVRKKNVFDFLMDLKVGPEILGTLEREGYWAGETRFRNFRTGEGIIVDTTAFTIRDDDGTPLYIATVTRDIRERKNAEARLQDLTDRLLRLQDDERRRIARDLHDSTGQNLAALKLNLARLENVGLPAGIAAMVSESVALSDKMIAEIRTLSYLLHPPLLDELGLFSAVRAYLDGFSARSGIEVEFSMPENRVRLGRDVELAMFRIIQESLTNVHKHSGSQRCWVGVRFDADQVSLEICDEGVGLPAEVAERYRRGLGTLGVGLAGMQERARQLGGRLKIESSAAGCRVILLLPAGAVA